MATSWHFLSITLYKIFPITYSRAAMAPTFSPIPLFLSFLGKHPDQSGVRGANGHLAKMNIIFSVGCLVSSLGDAHVPITFIFQHLLVGTFDAPITCVDNVYVNILFAHYKWSFKQIHKLFIRGKVFLILVSFEKNRSINFSKQNDKSIVHMHYHSLNMYSHFDLERP